MSTVNPDEILVRCSSLHRLLTHFDKLTFEKGHITLAREIYRQYEDDRRSVFASKYTEKGILREEEAITMVSLNRKVMLRKNDEQIKNSFISGHPDIYIGESIDKAIEGFDTKCSWEYGTFPDKTAELKDAYLYQNHGYMYLTGAKKWTTVHCLVNSPAYLIRQAQEKIFYAMDCPDEDRDGKHYSRYKETMIEIEKNHVFDIKKFIAENPSHDLYARDIWKWDMPLSRRILEQAVIWDESVHRKIDQRVTLLRGFIQNNLM